MTVIVAKNCKNCGKEPIWVQTPFGSGIGCSTLQCEGNEAFAPTMEEAVIKWNRLQEVNE